MLILEDTILFLFAAVLVSMVAARGKFPSALGLVVLGFGVGFLRQEGVLTRGLGHFELTDEVLLQVLLPPLLFAGALPLGKSLRKHSGLLLTLSLVGTLGSVLLIAAASKALIGWSWEFALLLAVIVVPTDPGNAVAIFRARGLPNGFIALVGGESLFNSGLCVLLSQLLVRGIAQGWGSIEATSALLGLLGAGFGGGLIGAAVGFLVNRLRGALTDPRLELLASIVIAYGSVVLSEAVGASGIMAVVFAGLFFGSEGASRVTPSTAPSALETTWPVFAFLANAIIFLAMGFQLDPGALVDHLGAIVAIFTTMVFARAMLTYGIAGFAVQRRTMPWAWVHALQWGGLKGAVPIALALSIGSIPGLEDQTPALQSITFGVVLLSLLVQGVTLTPLLGRLGLGETREPREQS